MPTPSDLADAYLAGSAQLRAAVWGMTRDQLTARPVAGKWSTLEVVAHIADFEPVMADRIQRVIALDNPLLLAADENDFVKGLFYGDRCVDEELAEIDAIRRKVARLILQVSPMQLLMRHGTHSVRGPLSLEKVIQSAINHIPHHVPFILEKRKALGLA